MKSFLIKKLGGYPTIKDAVYALKGMEDLALKNELLTEFVKHLFNAIDSDDILRVKNGNYWFRGNPLDKGRVEQIIDDAQHFQESLLWEVIKKDVKYHLNKKMFLESNLTVDIMWGKMTTWLFDVIKTRIESLSKLKK